MNYIPSKSPHSLHIPVMGTGFSIDTPIKVAQYGISSVLSVVDDILIEQMRKYHCERLGLPYEEIAMSEKEYRSRRITAYLNLFDQIVSDQISAVQSSPFEPGSGITKYFEMLPDSELRSSYLKMLAETDTAEKIKLQEILRTKVVAGSIDVNIMTKLDRDIYVRGEKLPPESADAMSALRGYAQSNVRSSIIFSAGINRRLYAYLAKFDDFLPDEQGELKKKIVLKVSDFRSAKIQGKFFAKRGLWVSEYRIESGLNCGGHAFASEGHLLGVILDEFRRHKEDLVGDLHEYYTKALASSDRKPVAAPHDVRVTVQGGIGTAQENNFLLEHYGVDGTGWGTPFLLVPEVTNVDDIHLQKLIKATEEQVYLSDSSPLGVPFWNLRTSSSEEARRALIAKDRPGSKCPKGFLVSNTEFTKVPICRASRVFQKRKLKQLDGANLSNEQNKDRFAGITNKSCICNDLSGGATRKLNIIPNSKTSVCCGPNIVNFSKIVSMHQMIDHIYGRISVITSTDKPHMFIRELSLYVDYLSDEVANVSGELLDRTAKRYTDFKENLRSGIDYYRELAEEFSQEQKKKFLHDLDALLEDLEKIVTNPAASVSLGTVS